MYLEGGGAVGLGNLEGPGSRAQTAERRRRQQSPPSV